jgi:hypothetical protein
MDDLNTTGTLDAAEAILTYTVSDEAIEAAAALREWVTQSERLCAAIHC